MKADDSGLTGLEAVKAQAEQWRREALVSVSNPGRLTGKDLTQILTYVQTCDRFAALCEKELESGLHKYAMHLAELHHTYTYQGTHDTEFGRERAARADALKEALEYLETSFPGSTDGILLDEYADDGTHLLKPVEKGDPYAY